jgi:glycosyltransferase involved in cell wall biosynthesis
MNHRQRILILAPRYPYPVIGGDRLRIYELCRELSQHHDLTLLSLCETQEELHGELPSDGIFKRTERIFLPKWRSVLNAMSALPGRIPLQVAYYKSAEFARRVGELLPEHDLCLAHLIRVGNYVRDAKIPTILEMTDAISLNYQRVKALRSTRNLRSLVYSLEANRLLEYERSVLDDFDLITLVSDIDRSFLLQNRVADHVLVCSNGVDLNALPFRDRRSSEPVVTFIGNLSSFQNLDACFYLAEEVFPLARQQLDCRFRIVGRAKPGDASRLARYPGVDVLANVVNVSDAVGRARVGVAPIRIGAGVQNKVLEYMSLGLPVITSSIGLEGLEARRGVDILVADTPQEYVSHLVSLWRDESFASSIGQAGYEYVKKNHSWSSRLSPLVRAISNISA